MRLRSFLSFWILPIIHVAFLIPVFIHHRMNLGMLIFLIFSGLAILYAYFRAFKSTKEEISATSLIIPIAVISGAVLTYYMSIDLKLGPVLATGISGLIGVYLPCVFRHEWLRAIPAPFYCGAFVGMCSPFIATGYPYLLLAGAFSGVIYLLIIDHFNGVGGKLGSIAFAGVALVSLISYLL